jgi:cell fate (sporulation/competence/biofilm development) regulator YlbF (YheA/YmcA/DUF963 family)
MSAVKGSEQAHFLAADTLANAIRQEPRWVEWNTAMEAAEADPELSTLMAQYKEMSALSRAGQGNVGEMTKLVDRIQRHPAFVRRETAAGGMVGLLREVDVAISQNLGVEFASTAAPQKSGGCCG